ncbi:MAG: molybdopterin-dependent oxidoreductase [Lachnospiraceae bacterium]|nr:molybdopterin-dependent oxidoreductase [Lachnospiraceae bacterium]
MSKITRRTFLKSAAAGAGILAAGSLAGCQTYFETADTTAKAASTENPSSAETEGSTETASAEAEVSAENLTIYETPQAQKKGGTWKPAYCGGCHMPICGTQVRVKDGVAVEIMGDLNSPTNEGKLCPRGLSVLGGLYHPYRAKVPMKRTNPEKGLDVDPGWVEIGWDEAMDTVAQKMNEAKEYNPNSFIYQTGFGNEDAFKRLILEAAFGSANSITTSGPLCADHYGPMALQSTKVERVDMEHCNYLLLIGRSLGDEWGLAHHNTEDYVQAVARGMKVVCVNPRKTLAAQKGEWVPVIPGTDAAFCWALVHSILYDVKKYDETFLKIRTNAPYLVEDKPEEHRGTKTLYEDYVRDPETGKPLVWDEKTNKAVPFDTGRGDDYAITGSYEVDGRTVKTAFQIVCDYVKDYTPEWAEEITTIPAAKTRKIAADLVENAQIGATIDIEGFEFPLRPAAVIIGRGANGNPMNVEMYKALSIVNEMLGNIDVPGGCLGIETADFHPLDSDADGMLIPPAYDKFAKQYVGTAEFEFPPKNFSAGCFYPMELGTIQLAWRSMLNPASYYIDYEPRVLLVYGGNAIRSNSNPEAPIEAMKKIPFVFNISLWMDEPTQFADIILPEHHLLERTAMWTAIFISNKGTTDKTRGLRALQARRPVVDPVYNTRLGEDIVIDIAERTGCLGKLNMIANNGFLGIYFKDKPLGLADEFKLEPTVKYSYDEICERKIKSLYGAESGWEDFKECAIKGYSVSSIKESYNWFYKPDNAYRIPVYFEYTGRNLKTMRDGMAAHNVTFPNADFEAVCQQYSAAPAWFAYESMEPTEEYPFKIFQYKSHFQVNDSTGLSFNPWLKEVQDAYDPYIMKILVPKQAADKLELKENDEVVVEAEYGQTIQAPIHISEMIHPQTIGVGGKWGRKGTHVTPFAKEGVAYNSLINDDERDIGFMMGNLNNSVRVKIYKA